jgi:phospholipid/cholesterol/gamma-HCH transport system substrate-binding protein
METQARYIIVGIFTVAAACAAFLFVYWLHAGAGEEHRVNYRIRFEAAVIGLRPGIPVLFNGLRVGDVTRVGFDPDDPKGVMAVIAVEPTTPVREDTGVGVDAQGLLGSVTVSLTGGASTTPLKPGPGGAPPLLIATPGESENLVHAAKVALTQLNTILEDNAKPLHNVIIDIGTFSATLAHNSGRIDSILAGLERMTGGGEPKAPPLSYGLAVPNLHGSGEAAPKALDTQIAVPEPTALVAFETQKVLAAPSPDELRPLEAGQWEDSIPKLVQAGVVRSFESAGFTHVGKATDGFTPEAQLLLDVRSFTLSLGTPPTARVEIAATVLGADGKIEAKRDFSASAPAAGTDTPAAAAALSKAFGEVARDLVAWARETI